MNESKTNLKYLVENIDRPETVTSTSREPIELVEDFVYLGGKIKNTVNDVLDRKRKTWSACHHLVTVWKSNLLEDLKMRLFTDMVESVLLHCMYGSET